MFIIGRCRFSLNYPEAEKGLCMDLALKCVTEKYATFSGRAQRKEFWLYVLAYLVLYLIALAVDFSAGTFDRESELGLLTGLLSLGMLIPSLGVP